MHWTPETLAAAANGRLLHRSDQPISGAFIDSRAPLPGALFIPIVAARDGHAFIPAAIAGGASAILVAPGRAPAHPPEDPPCTVVEVDDTFAALQALARTARAACPGPVVAVTGSNGKTTTRAMIAAVMQTRYARVLATRGNFNNHLGVPLTLLGPPDDPDAAVLELGMNAPGENDRLAALVAPQVAVITSVALEHLEFMGDLATIAAAEAETLRHLPSDGLVVIPDDEPLLIPWLPPGRCVLRFGRSDAADVQIVEVHQDARTRVHLRLRWPGRPVESVQLNLRLFGGHNANNAAAALAVGLTLGCDVSAMVAALDQVEPVGDRSRVLHFGPHLVIADCYNANPGSMSAALHALAAVRSRRCGPLIAVLGDMLELGPAGPELHAELGTLAATLRLDAVFTFGALAKHTAAAAQAGGIAAWHASDNMDDIIAAVRSRLGRDPGAVLVKGSRGMRMERIVEALTAG